MTKTSESVPPPARLRAQAVTGCLVWALDRTTFRHTILAAGQQRRQKYEAFLANVSFRCSRQRCRA